MLVVTGEDHPFLAHEQTGAVPLRNAARFPDLGFIFALVPRQSHGRLFASWAITVASRHRCRRNLRVRWRSARVDRQRRLQFQRPEREIVPVAPEVAHRPVPEIPPAIPFWSRKIDRVKWT